MGESTATNRTDDLLGHLPKDLLHRIQAEAPAEAVQAHARHDLDDRGMYCEGHLVLTDKRLGHFRHLDGTWRGRWLPTAQITGTAIVEGLGMGILRLVCNQSVVGEFRFTLRHAKEMAKIHRRLERRMQGKEEASAEQEMPRADEKKIRCDKCERVIPPWTDVCPACLSRRKVLSRLMDFVRPYRWRAVTGMLLAVLVTVAALIRPALTKPMLDDGLGTGGAHQANFSVLMAYILLMAVLMVIAALAGGVRERLMAMMGATVSRDIRDRTYAHLHRLSLSFFSKRPTGSLITRVTSDSERIWDFLGWTIVEVFTSVLTIVGVGIALFVMNWRLACIVLLPVPLMFFFTIVFHKMLHKGFDRLFHRWSLLTAVVADALPGVRVIKAFSQEKREVSHFRDHNARYFDDEVGMITLWTLFGPVMQFCTQLGSLLVWIVGGWWAVRDFGSPNPTMTVGTLMAFTG